MRETSEQRAEHDALNDRRHLIDTLRDLGGVDLRQPRRTIGFERRRERADERLVLGQLGGKLRWSATSSTSRPPQDGAKTPASAGVCPASHALWGDPRKGPG